MNSNIALLPLFEFFHVHWQILIEMLKQKFICVNNCILLFPSDIAKISTEYRFTRANARD